MKKINEISLCLLIILATSLSAQTSRADEEKETVKSREIAGTQDFSKAYLESITDERAHEKAIEAGQIEEHARALRDMEHGHRSVGH